MTTQVTETVWLNEHQVCRIEHLAEVSGLSIAEIEDLVDSGIIVPAIPAVQPPAFQLHYVVILKTARRLRDDFQLDNHGLALALNLLQRIESLEQQLSDVHARARHAPSGKI